MTVVVGLGKQVRADAYLTSLELRKRGGGKVGTIQNLLNSGSLSLFLVVLVFSSPVSFVFCIVCCVDYLGTGQIYSILEDWEGNSQRACWLWQDKYPVDPVSQSLELGNFMSFDLQNCLHIDSIKTLWGKDKKNN